MSVHPGRVRTTKPVGRRREAHDRRVAAAPVPAPPAVQPAPPSSGLPRDEGMVLFTTFVVATLVMVAAVVLVDAVDRWWILVPVMLVDLALTSLVVGGIAHLLADDGEQHPEVGVHAREPRRRQHAGAAGSGL